MKFVLVVALVIGVTSFASPIFAQSSSSAPGVTGPEPAKVLARPETSPRLPAGVTAPSVVPLAYMRVAGAAFTPRVSSTGYSYGMSQGGGICVTSAPSGEPLCHAPVYLPQGSLVNGLRMYFYRPDTSTSCYAWLTVYTRYGDIVQEFSVTPGVWTGYNWEDAAPFSLTVDNINYIYMLNWRPDSNSYSSNMTLESFSIFYYPPARTGAAAVITLD